MEGNCANRKAWNKLVPHFENINDNTFATNGIQISLNMLSKVMMNNYLGLDFLLASYGGVYTMAKPLCCFGPMEQVRHNRLHTALRKKILGTLSCFSCPMGFVFLAWVGQLGLLLPKHLTGHVICCCCVCVWERERERERDSGHDAGLTILFQNLKSSMQLLSCPIITVMTQQQKRSRRSLNIVDQGEIWTTPKQ